MKLTLCPKRHIVLVVVVLLLTLSATPSFARRGGGGGSDSNSDGGSNSGSGDDSGSSGSSGSSPSTEDCDNSAKLQMEYITSGQGSHYNGTLRVRHNIIAQETTETNYNAVCEPSNLGTKVYTYPEAYLLVGLIVNPNDTNPLYWELTAYIPFISWSGYGTQRGSKMQIVKLQSQSYTGGGYSLRNGTFGYPDPILRECWDATVTRTANRSANATVDVWNIGTHFKHVSEYEDPPSSMYPDRTSNWMTISNICVNGFSDAPYPYVTPPKYNGNNIGTAFMESGANATLENVGADHVSFKMDNGKIDQGVFGTWKWDTACDQSGFGMIYEDMEAYRPSSPLDPDMYLNFTVEFSLEFEGTLWKEKSMEVVKNVTNSTAGGLAPVWSDGHRPAPGGRLGAIARLFLLLVMVYSL